MFLSITVWVKKVAPHVNFLRYFFSWCTCAVKMTLVIVQTYSYVYTNFGPFIWIFVWHVSLLPVRPLKFSEFNSVCYEIHEFFVKNTSHIKRYLINIISICYTNCHVTMFKISTVGWRTCPKSIAVVFHSVVNGFLWQGRPNQLKCICKLRNCFELRLLPVIKL